MVNQKRRLGLLLASYDFGLKSHGIKNKKGLGNLNFNPRQKEYVSTQTKAQPREPIEPCFSGNDQQKGELHGLKVIRSNGFNVNRPSSNNSFSALSKVYEEDIGLQNLTRSSSFGKKFISKGKNSLLRQIVYEDEGVYSDPGVDSVPSKRISRRKIGRQPKRKEGFRVGKIRKWNKEENGQCSC